ncbi:MAG: tetratricopeptide repeat protein [Gemmataceae bacterium]
MSDVLCFVDHLIERSRRLAASAQLAPALELLHDVESFPLPPARAEEVQRLLAEGYLSLKRYRRAHRHLRRAARLAPRTARYHHLLGVCVASHPRGRQERALKHFRRALRLAPTQRRTRAEAGLAAVRVGQVEAGLSMLRRAADGEPGLVGQLVRGYCEAGRPDDARRAVLAARFTAPHCPKLVRLLSDLQTGRLRGEQASRRADAAPVLLPFVHLRRVT